METTESVDRNDEVEVKEVRQVEAERLNRDGDGMDTLKLLVWKMW